MESIAKLREKMNTTIKDKLNGEQGVIGSIATAPVNRLTVSAAAGAALGEAINYGICYMATPSGPYRAVRAAALDAAMHLTPLPYIPAVAGLAAGSMYGVLWQASHNQKKIE